MTTTARPLDLVEPPIDPATAILEPEQSVPRPPPATGVVARNTALNLLGQALPLVAGLASMPVIVREMGSARFGILTLSWTLLGYLSMFDFGLTRAATKFVAELVGAGRRDEVPAIAWTTIAFQTALGLVGAAVLATLAHPLAYRLLHVPPQLAPEAFRCFLILAVAFPIVLVFNSLRGLLEASQRFDLVNVVRVPANTFYFLIPLVGALLHRSLAWVMVGFIMSWSAGALAEFLFCRRVYPALRGAPRVDLAQAKRLVRFGGWVTISGAISPALVYTDRIVIGMLATVEAVTYYAAPFDMVTRLLVIPSSLVATLFPAFSAASVGEGRGERELGPLIARSTKFLLLALGPAILIIVAFAPLLLGKWLGAEFAARSSLALRLLAVGVLANAMAQIPFSLVQGVGRPEVAAKFHLVELPLHIALLWFAVSHWGITGAAAAWSTRVFLDAALLYVAGLRVAHIPARALAEHGLLRAVALLATAGLVLALARLVTGVVAVQLVVAAITAAAGAVVTWRWVLVADERASLVRLVARRSTPPADGIAVPGR